MSDSEQLAALQREYRAYRLRVFFFLPLLAAAGISTFWNRYAALVLLGGAVAYQLLSLRPRQNRYTDAVVRENLRRTICRQLGAQEPAADGGAITEQTVRAAALIPLDERPQALRAVLGITGEKDGLAVMLCDATAAESFRLVEKGRKRVHFNCGCWVHILLPQDTGCDWRALDKDSVPTPIRTAFFSSRHSELEDAPWPDPALREKYVLYRPVERPEQAPSDAVCSQLRLLAGYTPGYAAVSLQGKTLDIFLRARFLARPVSLKAPPAVQQLDFDPLPELAYLLRLAKVLSQEASAAQPR